MIFRLAFKHIFLSAESSYWQLARNPIIWVDQPPEVAEDGRHESHVTRVYPNIYVDNVIPTNIHFRINKIWGRLAFSQCKPVEYKSIQTKWGSRPYKNIIK